MDEGLESNPLYKDVQDYLGRVSPAKTQAQLPQMPSQVPVSGKKWSLKPILFVAIPIFISLAIVIVIFNPPGILKKLFTGKYAVVDVSNVANVTDVSDQTDISGQGSETLQRFSIGRILDIKQTPSGLQLITDIKDAENITVTQDSNLVFVLRHKKGTLNDSERSPATLGDLKIGQTIRVSLVYSPKTGTWSVKNVSIRQKI